MIAFVFPGQGSQNKGMGETLFDEFAELTAQADAILGFPIKELCLSDPRSQLSETRYAQPALYMVNALSHLKKISELRLKPDFVVGHSLGEYNALFASGAFDFGTGLKLVKKRAELMSHAAGGGMAAIIGLKEEQVTAVLKSSDLQRIEIANLNSTFQIIISGPKTDIEKAKSLFEKMKDVSLFTSLKTSGAFHSRYMAEAKAEFEFFLRDFSFSDLTIPVISNVDARPYRQSEIKQRLAEQITHPVKWSESIRYLMGLGVTEFVEIGVGRILTGIIQRIRKEDVDLAGPRAERESKKDAVSADMKPEMQKNNVHLKQGVRATAPKTPEGEKDKVKKEKAGTVQEKSLQVLAATLGSNEFKKEYGLKYAYLTGGMYRGIASKEMVIKMGKAGMMGFLGSGGMDATEIKIAIQHIQKELAAGQAYGVNFLHNPNDPIREEKVADLFLALGVTIIEASAFLSITPSLVKFRAKGLSRGKAGQVIMRNKIIAKLSRPEVAEAFLSPAPDRIVDKLLLENKITPEEAELCRHIPVADDICVEADSGGHTDGGVAYVLMPSIIKLRDEMTKKYNYGKNVRVGAAGGIGTPEAAAASFILGADFILTGSINQCTVEAATSEAVKNLLQQMNVQDTEYAPAGDMFELGAKVQVLKKGLFFAARANKLYDLYRQYNSLSEIDPKTKTQIQEKYFKKSFEEIYEDTKSYYTAQDIERAERNPKFKMVLIFRWYFGYSTRLALTGSEENKVDYQIHCGPALGAFNQWVRGTDLEDWTNRHVDQIGEKIMIATAKILNRRFHTMTHSLPEERCLEA